MGGRRPFPRISSCPAASELSVAQTCNDCRAECENVIIRRVNGRISAVSLFRLLSALSADTFCSKYDRNGQEIGHTLFFISPFGPNFPIVRNQKSPFRLNSASVRRPRRPSCSRHPAIHQSRPQISDTAAAAAEAAFLPDNSMPFDPSSRKRGE